VAKGKVQFVLDEAASLGQMDAIGDALDKYRGYGVRLLLLYQSVGQLKRCWPEGQDQTLLSNVTQVFFGVNDYQTAEYVSNRLGKETIVVDSGGTSDGGSEQSSIGAGGLSQSCGASWNDNRNWSQAARELLRPEEVLALDERAAITFAPGLPPIWTWLLRYYEGMPRPAGWWHRAKLFAGSCFYFFAAILVAAALTAAVANRVNPSMPSNYFQVR
jgi:type IV secretion system protein VirD4